MSANSKTKLQTIDAVLMHDKAPKWRQLEAVNPSEWFCIYTKPKRERQALEYVESRLGFEVFFPCITRTKTIRRVQYNVSEPLFPRYFFCKFEMNSAYRAVRYAHDVLDVVSFGGVPAIVANKLIEQLKAWCAEGPEAVRPSTSLVPGDRVTVLEGPMKGLEAVILEDTTESERVTILLGILGCGARVSVDRFDLKKTA
ncbi:MAG: transcription termination/antitermination NusG family protein [Nibricoccus sp.]